MRPSFHKIAIMLLLCLTTFQTKAQLDRSTNQLIERMFEQLEQKQYFDLRRIYNSNELRLPSSYALFFGAHLDAAFNAPKESNAKITDLLQFPSGTIEPRDMLGLLSIKQQNHIHLFEYKQAWQTSKFITSTYSNMMNQTDYDNYTNTEKLWLALLNTPKQTLEQNADVSLKLTKDKANLYRINTSFETENESFVFDTGANFSVMQRSVAEKLGLEIIDTNFLTSAATGKLVQSDVAVVPELKIGEMTIHHAVFIIFDDEQLQFPEADYQIEGIIGFPIIRAMKEIHISQQHTLFVPKNKTALPTKNLALDGLFPIVEINCNDVPLAFHFDTGANITMLYPLYYKKFQKEINKKYTAQQLETASAGGSSKSTGFILKKTTFGVNNKSTKIKDVYLIIDGHNTTRDVYGNLGQDFFENFKGYVLNFESSCFWVE
ncbi:MAG: retropepsin-like aspartic protease [Mangrovibacterium sp.]